MRIVSLLASATEFVCALGAGSQLVGRSHECDNPDWVRSLPSVTEPAFSVEAGSREIDAEVRRRLSAGEPLYHVDTAKIRALQPDLLITQAHCRVCAVTSADFVPGLAGSVLSLSAGSLAGIFADIRRVATALHRTPDGEQLIRQGQDRLTQLQRHSAEYPAKTVVVLEWTDPPFSMGNWGPELIRAANGHPLLSEDGHCSRSVAWREVTEADPDQLIVAPCGFGLARSVAEAQTLEARPGWFDLRAVRAGRVAFADGNRYFNRSGITVFDTAELIAEILHAPADQRKLHGTAWQGYTRMSRTTSPEMPVNLASNP